MKNRILAISARADFGGGSEHLYTLSTGLVSTYTVDIACPNQLPYWPKFAESINGKLIEIPFRKLSLRAVLSLALHIKKNDISIIHTHGKGAGVYGRLLTLITGTPHLHTPHGIHTENYGKLMRAIYYSYEKLTGFLNKTIIFVSPSEQETASKIGLWKNIPRKIVPNGVKVINTPPDPEKKIALRDSLDTGHDAFVIVALSRFDIAKNMMEAANVASQLIDKPEIIFWFLGDGDDRPAVQAFCKDHDITSVRFPGFVNDPIKYLSAANAYLSTSRWEGLPLAVLEAMSLGLPVIASNVVGNKDAVCHEVSGFLYPLGQPELAATYISELISNPEINTRLSLAAKKRQEQLFSTEAMIASTISVYNSLSTS